MTDSNDSTPDDPRARDDEVFSTRRIWHGMLTYDYFSMVKALRKDGVWSGAESWSEVPFPISIVLFGEAEKAPWAKAKMEKITRWHLADSCAGLPT